MMASKRLINILDIILQLHCFILKYLISFSLYVCVDLDLSILSLFG